jgi:hypothetical protein
MKIYDCFQFFNEEDILDIRLNILSPFVDYFIITESVYDHQGNLRELVFNRKKFEKFNHKINYIIVNNLYLDKKYKNIISIMIKRLKEVNFVRNKTNPYLNTNLSCSKMLNILYKFDE